jgi:hypothetical protein
LVRFWEREADARHFSSDVAQPDDAKGLAFQVCDVASTTTQ